MEYDEADVKITIDSLEELRLYVKQNEDQEIRRRKYVREALRALDVSAPLCVTDKKGIRVSYEGSENSPESDPEKRTIARSRGVFKIEHRCSTRWRNLENINAGFNCTIQVEQHDWIPAFRMRHLRKICAEDIGITPDFQLIPKL